MHMLQIVHSDIKPTNIMFSTHYGKQVFLDFGTAELIDKEWGCKISTKFRGTYEFSGEEMRNIFISQKAEMIDLYKNDVKMLSHTI